MKDSAHLSGPQRSLLATDLGTRCDRPLERALVRVPMGSRAQRLLRDLMCDTLVVRAGKGDGDA